jgi:serine/threonine-protein kinase
MTAQPASVEPPTCGDAYRNFSRLASSLDGEEVGPFSDRVGSYRTGDVIGGKYQLGRVLCQGGMGSVWVAYNQALDVQVALKLIRPDVKGSFMTERFMIEGRLAARLEHPSIIDVHDLGNTDRGDPYLVMELLHGGDLRSLLEEQSKFPPEHAVQLLLPIADGLATAHAKGVVHRDLKPENVFLAKSDDRLQPKILDFGIAKPALTPGQRRITRAGAVVGSPDYMSPEQARGFDVDHRADVWAFCAVLYECVTGRSPFADSPYDLLLCDIIEKPVKPISEYGVGDLELWRILNKGLAKDRDQRYNNMREVGRDLAQWLRDRGIEEDVCGHSLRATWFRTFQSQPDVTPESEDMELCATLPCRTLPYQKPPERSPVTPTGWWFVQPRPASAPSAPRPGRLRFAAMLMCSAAIGAAAVQWSPLAMGATNARLRSSLVIAAARVAHHERSLRHTLVSTEILTSSEPAVPAVPAVEELQAPPSPRAVQRAARPAPRVQRAMTWPLMRQVAAPSSPRP